MTKWFEQKRKILELCKTKGLDVIEITPPKKRGTYTLECGSHPELNKIWRRKEPPMWSLPKWIMTWIKDRMKECNINELPEDVYIHFDFEE